MFENACELDLQFHADKVHTILAEMMRGTVLETNMDEILERAEVSGSSSLWFPVTQSFRHGLLLMVCTSV